MNLLVQTYRNIRCGYKGHRFLASRTEPDVEVCVRCRKRRPAGGHAAGAFAILTKPSQD